MDNKNYEKFLIESSKRDQGTSTSFNFSLSRPIKNIHRIDLLYASLNNTFYTLDQLMYSNGMKHFMTDL